MGERTIATAATMTLGRGDLPVGALFADRYEILGLLGRGGMGVVHRVLDRELGEEIALKLLDPEVAAGEGALERFRREVKLARRVTHVNVARTYDLGNADGVRYLTMELIPGEPLSRRGGRMALGEALRIAAEIARGLVAAHAVGVVHRDLKPDNVLLAGTRVVITDFGIARLAEGADAQKRTLGLAMGTPAYMAPEQVEGRALDGRADVYALGLVLYELLIGELPFKGDTPWALAAARLDARVLDPRAVLPDLPENVAELVVASLARRREERLDASQFVERVDAIRGEAPARVVTPRVELASPGGPRTVALSPLRGGDLAHDLTAALSSALAKVRGARVLAPGSVATAEAHSARSHRDPCELGRALRASLVIEGTVRVAGPRVRVSVSLVDVATAAQTWADDFSGTVDDPFALEDAVVAGVSSAVKQRVSSDTPTARADTEVRPVVERARVLLRRYNDADVREAIALLRGARERSPNDPHVLAHLGAALVRAFRNRGGGDASAIAEAEELTLRALSIDPSIPETFLTIGVLRASQGALRAAVRAFEEAVARGPRLGEAHAWLARLCFESGRMEEGLKRLEHAVQVDPDSPAALGTRAQLFALTGRLDEAKRLVAAIEPRSSVYLRTRLTLWHRDAELAAETARDIEASPEAIGPLGPLALLPLLRAIADGTSAAEPARKLRAYYEERGRASTFAVLTIDALLVAGLTDEALDLLDSAAPSMLELAWLDHAPLLAPLREDDRFARARASMAARAAQLWA